MKTYYLSFKVAPENGNNNYGKIAGAYAHFWIVAQKADSAAKRAEAYLFQECWEILSPAQSAVEVTAGQFAENDIGLENYRLAQERGMAAAICAWTEDADLIKSFLH